MLQGIEPSAQAVVSQPLVVTSGGQIWTLDPVALGQALGYRRDGDLLAVVPIPTAWGRSSISPPPGSRGPAPTPESSRTPLVCTRSGRDRMARCSTAARRWRRSTPRSPGSGTKRRSRPPQTPPAVVAADLEPIRARLEQILVTPSRSLSRGQRPHPPRVQPLIRLTEQPTSPEKVDDRARPGEAGRPDRVIANDLDQPVWEANFKLVNGASAEDHRARRAARSRPPTPTRRCARRSSARRA